MSNASTEKGKGPTAGGTIELSPLEFVFLHDNDSLNGVGKRDSLNRGKNTNVFSPNTIRSTAVGYARGLEPETTGMISCPASPEYGTPPAWLKCCMEATKFLKGTNEVAMGELIKVVGNELLESPGDISWAQALRATLWRPKEYGLPNEDFVRVMPTLITIQGQNRAAVMIASLHGEAGVPKSRAGGHSDIDLFEGEGAQAKQEQLKTDLLDTHQKVRPYVYSFLSYVEAEVVGRKTHAAETLSRKPGLYTAVKRQEDIVLQTSYPTVPLCQARMEQTFGPEWFATLVPKSGVEPGQAAKAAATKLQKDVLAYIEAELGGSADGLGSGTEACQREPFKGTSFMTLVYGSALKPDAPIIKLALKRLLAEDESNIPAAVSAEGRHVEEGGEKKKGRRKKAKSDIAPKTTPECLAQLFGLHEDTQQSRELVDMIGRFGLGNKVKDYAADLAKEDLVRWLCESLGRREWSGEPGQRRDIGGIVAVWENLVTAEDADRFTKNADEILTVVLADATKWFRWLCRSAVLGQEAGHVSSINKKALQKEYGRMASRDANLSNKSSLYPGIGKVPRLSISSAKVVFSPSVLGEWLSFEDTGVGKKGDPSKGKRVRMLALEFAGLVVERALSKQNTFQSLWNAMDDAGLLKTVLKKNPNALTMAGVNFFDEARVRAMSQGDRVTKEGEGKEGVTKEGEGGAKEGPSGGQAGVEIRSANGERLVVSMTPIQRKRFGLLRADGAAVTEVVTVTLKNLPGGDAQGEPNDGGDAQGEPGDGGEPAMSEGSLSKNDSDNDDAADDSQSPRDTTGKPRGVKRKASYHETNYEDGGTEFDDDSDGNPDTSEERQPVAQQRFDQGEDAEKAMAEITRVINMGRNKWSKESKVSEGLVSDFFKEELFQQGLYRNVDLAASALHATEGTTVYVTMPAVLNTLKGRKPNVDDLRHPEKAKFMFFPGNGHGSLVDLVIGEHSTSFPSDYVCMSAADLGDAGTPIAGRKDRTSARSGLSRGTNQEGHQEQPGAASTDCVEKPMTEEEMQGRALKALQLAVVSGFIERATSTECSCLSLCNTCRKHIPVKFLRVGCGAPPAIEDMLFPASLQQADDLDSSRVSPYKRVLKLQWLLGKSASFGWFEKKDTHRQASEARRHGDLVTTESIDMSKIRWPDVTRENSLCFFSLSIDIVTWPEGLEILRFGHPTLFSAVNYRYPDVFNMPLEGLKFPPGIREIYFGGSFNEPIEGIALPVCLERLSLPGFNQSIRGVQWPAGLKSLEFVSPSKIGVWKYGGTDRDFMEDYSYGGPEEQGQGCFNQPLGTTLPASLERLWLSNAFDQPLDDVAWPSGIVILGLAFDSLRYRWAETITWPSQLRDLFLLTEPGRGMTCPPGVNVTPLQTQFAHVW